MRDGRLRVVIIEAQVLFAKALSAIFADDSDFEVISDHRAPEAVTLAAARPHVIVIDLDGQPTDVAATLGICSQAAPDGRICVLSMHLSRRRRPPAPPLA